jgi:hypothetical protein
MYQLVDLSGPVAIGAPGPLPLELQGATGDGLLDLSWMPPEYGYEGKGLWPVEIALPVLTGTEVATGEIVSKTLDADRKVVVAAQGKRLMTEDEIEALRNARLDALAARRWQAEEGGMSSPPMATDRVTQAKLTGAYVKATQDPAFTVNWKVGRGAFVTLDAATIIALGDAVTTHVQTCFDREAALTAQILAAADPTSIDINTGWPS